MRGIVIKVKWRPFGVLKESKAARKPVEISPGFLLRSALLPRYVRRGSKAYKLKGSIMELATLLNIVSTLALVGALMFAGLQIRAGNRVRDEQAAIKLIEAALGTVLAQPATLLAEVSPTVSSADVVNFSPETLRAIQETSFRLEALGYLVFIRVVSVQSVEDLMGGLIALWWSKERAGGACVCRSRQLAVTLYGDRGSWLDQRAF